MSGSKDLVILVMGTTGAGKSSFVNLLLSAAGNPRPEVKVGHGLQPCTTQLESVIIEGQITRQGVRFKNLTQEHRIVIVDTPGFEGVKETDTRILCDIATWLKKRFKKQAIFGGIIYLHDISEDRFPGSAKQNLKSLKRLYGDAALDKVVLVTSKWSLQEPRRSEEKEQQLKEKYWETLISPKEGDGAHVMRLLNPKGEGVGAWAVVCHILVQLDNRLSQETLDIVRQNQGTFLGSLLRGVFGRSKGRTK